MGERKYQINVLDRGAAVLKAFTLDEPRLSLSEIASRTELPISTCLRLLSTWCFHGLVARDEATGRYHLGYALLALAEIAASQGGLSDWAVPVMNDLCARYNETVVLSVRSGDDRVDIRQVIGRNPVRRVIATGVPKPLYAGAASRVLLAGVAPAELEAYLSRVEIVRLAEHTITDPDELRRRVQKARKTGFAESVQEQSDGGGAGVAAPIVDARGETVAALGFSVPQFRFTRALRSQLVPAVRAAAERISATLGGRGRESA